MTERNLALALMRAGRVTMEQVQAAARMRTTEKNLSHVLVELGWVPSADILLFDPRAFETPPLLTPATAGAMPDTTSSRPSTSTPETSAVDSAVAPTLSASAAPSSQEAMDFPIVSVMVENATGEANGHAVSGAENGASPAGLVTVTSAVAPAVSPTIVPVSATMSTVPIGLGYEAPPQLSTQDVRLDGDDSDIEDAAMGATVRAANEILLKAVQMGASDVHLEPRTNGVLPRYRVDGHLRTGALLPREMLAPLVSRMKVMANLNITETRLSQDGRFRASVGGHRLDFRVSTLPGIHGEKVVLRLLDHSALVTDLTRLGFTEGTHAQFDEMLRRAHGMILVTGPTGSGKSTTLYAALASTLDEAKNVVTVEDPVEYELEGVMQCHVHVEIGNTFAARLRSILRQDPDVILVGEIRDSETADIAVRAALTGHLVLSTLHTNSAVASVARLQDMGVPPFLIASSLSGIVAQRLVRLICRHCRQAVPLHTPEHDLAVAQLKLRPDTTIYQGVGCEECHGTGYRGRVAVMELLNIDKDIRRAIMERVDADQLQGIARANGMRTIYQDSIDKLKHGLTTAEELARVLLGNEEIELV